MTRAQVVRALVPRLRASGKTAARAYAPANIALVKYWGKSDPELNIPLTDSLSVTLPELGADTRIELAEESDEYVMDGKPMPMDSPFSRRLSGFLDLFRGESGMAFRVDTRANIPMGTGLASSASGFAALTKALDSLFEWGLSPCELSVLARLGSGSACRSMFGGFVEWRRGSRADGMDSYAAPLRETWPDFCLGILVLSRAEKPISSRDAMRKTLDTSTLYRAWPEQVRRDMASMKEAISRGDFELLGATAEANALAMHATMLASAPAICYWLPESLAAMRTVWELRRGGLPVYFTMDAGPNIKLLFERTHEASLRAAFPGVGIARPFDAMSSGGD